MSSPTTPPSVARSPKERKRKKQHVKTPSSYAKKDRQFYTPNTPHRNQKQQAPSVPRYQDEQQLTPETPRNVGRKNRLAGAIQFTAGPMLSSIQEPTIGLGSSLDVKRSFKVDTQLQKMPQLDIKKQRRTSFDESDDETQEEGLRKVSKRLQFDLDDDDNVPSTPRAQLTSTEYAYNRYIKEKNTMDDDETEQQSRIPNPFVGSFKERPATIPDEYKRFEHEIELVDRNGKRKVIQLDKTERAIKPKRLFTEESLQEFQTPHGRDNPNQQVLPEEDDNEDELIRKEKILNPFRGKFPERETKSTEIDELEYINHSTGERVVRKMTDEEASIKPRRLRFD